MSIRLLEDTKTPLVWLPTALVVENFTENPPYNKKSIDPTCMSVFFRETFFQGAKVFFFQQPSPRHLKKKNRAESIPRVRFRWNGRNFHHRTLWVTARSNVLGRNRFRFTPTWCAARRFLNSIRHPFFFFGGLFLVGHGIATSGWWFPGGWCCLPGELEPWVFLESFSQFWGCFGRSVLRCNRLHLPRWQLMRLVMDTPREATHQHKLPRSINCSWRPFCWQISACWLFCFFVDDVVGGCNERRLEWYRW